MVDRGHGGQIYFFAGCWVRGFCVERHCESAPLMIFHPVLHLLFEVAAYSVACALYSRSRRSQGDLLSGDERLWMIVAAAGGALAGSRILGALEEPQRLREGPAAIFAAFRNRTVVGALLGGWIVVEITKKIRGVRVRTGDLFTEPLIVGMVVGRVGCLLGGMEDRTFGTPTDLPWGLDHGDGVLRHPTNLYEILWLSFVWFTIRTAGRRATLPVGAKFRIFMLLYLAFRFVVEWIKPQPVVAAGLSSIQWACIGGLVFTLKRRPNP